jgi:uncharacterized coiled-coil DUF342 family protein
MTTKQEFVDRLNAQLEEWKEDIEQLRLKAADAADDAQAKIHEEIAELKTKWDEGESKRQEMLHAADEKWDDLKEDAEEGWTKLTAFVKDSLDRVKGKFS